MYATGPTMVITMVPRVILCVYNSSPVAMVETPGQRNVVGNYSTSKVQIVAKRSGDGTSTTF